MRIGVDVGGTKIETIALGDEGRELYRRRITTPKEDYEATIGAIVDLVRRAERELKERGTVGVGIPGAISPATGLVKNANSTWLIGKPLDKDLSHELEREVRVQNDANCFAVSEAVDGAGADATCVFGVIIGTGTGGGIAINKRVLTGPNAIAGEWGHIQLPWMTVDELPGPDCYCGKQGCIETFLSGPGMAHDHQRATGETLTAEEIVQRAEANDAGAEETLRRYEDRMARGLAAIITVLDPDAVVLGGGMGNIRRLYRHVPRLWQRYAFSDHVDTPLVPPAHGDSSGVRGAAWLWPPGEKA